MQSLESALLIGTVRDNELAHLLMEQFHSGQQDGEDVLYSVQGEQWAIRLRYKRGRITAAFAGPGLNEEVLNSLSARIRDELLAPQRETVGRVVRFSSVPLTASVRVEPLFQIMPIAPEAPRPPYAMGDHPFVLEFRHTTSLVTWVGSFRRESVATELTLLLNVLVFWGARDVGRTRHQWTLVPGSDASDWRSEYLQEGYFAPGFAGSADAFSPTNGSDAMVYRPDAKYYAQLGIGADQCFDLPESFPQLVEVFRALEGPDRSTFLRAAHWYSLYLDAWYQSRSLAYVCLISAIEALVPSTPGDPPCPTCNRSPGPGPTRLFKESLDDLVPRSRFPMQSGRDELYRIRSSLSHGSALLRLDTQREAFLNPATTAEYGLIQEARMLAQLSLVEWLRRHVP